MLTLTLLYTTFAAVSTLRGAFYGLAPVVLGILIASAATPAVRALIGIPYRGRTRNRI